MILKMTLKTILTLLILSPASGFAGESINYLQRVSNVKNSIPVSRATQQLIQACNLLEDPIRRQKCLAIRTNEDWKKIEQMPQPGKPQAPVPPILIDPARPESENTPPERPLDFPPLEGALPADLLPEPSHLNPAE